MEKITITPLGRRIVVRKCVNDHVRDENGEVTIWMPDQVYEQTNTCEIIDVSEDCKLYTAEHIGTFIEVPEFIDGLDALDEDLGLFFIREEVADVAPEMGFVMIKEDSDG